MELQSSFLTQKDIALITAHAVNEYPFECCGIVVGSKKNSGYNRVFQCKNIQDALHSKNPVKFPRDAKTAYYIDPKELLFITAYTEKNNLAFRAFYHSHPDHDVYFSLEDKKNALFFDEPLYPDALYIILSVYNKNIKDRGIFMWNQKKKDFVQT